MKPTNKAGQPGAEVVEPRAGTKGKAGQQSTRRAQNRESVSQALDRIRQAARQRKKERFTALFHHISLDLLRMAFLDLKRNAAPGVDGLTWQDYEADLEVPVHLPQNTGYIFDTAKFFGMAAEAFKTAC
jgi:RNA-directed DNA polymerase